jgi:hypothetical protein
MKFVKLFIVFVFVIAVPFNAEAAFLTYSPDAIDITVNAGETTEVPFSITLIDARGTYGISCNFSYTLQGNLPRDWVVLPRGSSIDIGRSTTVSEQLKLMVPTSAAPGTYSGNLIPIARMSTGERVDIGEGIPISVTVASLECGVVPTFADISFYPEEFWAPNNKLVEMEITGVCNAPDGCNIRNVWYVIEDEYGEYSGPETIAISSDGIFNLKIPIEASRKGKDKDGRLYTITLYAEDEAGIGQSSSFDVRVGHDQSKK